MLVQAHFEKFKLLFDGYKKFRREDKFMFLRYDTADPENRTHAQFILEQIVNWLYTGELKVLHKVEASEESEGWFVEKSEYLTELREVC